MGALALASCMKEADTGIPAGMLRANIVQPGEETRTSFDGGTGKFRWSEGDRIAIHMSTGYFTEAEIDYRTGFFSCPTTESRRRDFYAVYPASIAVEGAYGNPDLDVTLPAEYDISDKLTSDYSPLPMIARNREEESDLWFNHAGGLIRIILNDVPATAAQVRVSFEHNVTGTYRVHWTGDLLPYIADGGDNSVVIFRLAESTLGAVTNGIRINVPVPTGHYGRVTIEVLGTGGTVLSTVSSDMNWDCRRGHGKLFEMETSSYTFTSTGEVTLSAYPGGTSSLLKVTSYKVRNTTGTSEAVAWEVDGYFADADCTEPFNGSDASQAPAWLTSLGTDGAGLGSIEPETAPIVYKAMPETLESEIYSPEAQVINNKIAASSFGAGSSPFHYLNISNPLDRNSDFIAESANCYIVNGPGYYRIPLVMGNGVMDNFVNSDERTFKGSDGTDQVLFVDYKGNNPSNPYLHKSSVGVGTPTSAFVVWEDEDRFIEVANTDDYALPAPSLVCRNDVWWLQFHVVKPVQANAVIAVADENGDVMWSWHIWQTDYVPKNYGGREDIPVTAYDERYVYEMPPKNLGYVESGVSRRYALEGGAVYVRLRQEGSNALCTVHIDRPSGQRTFELDKHYGTFYQWGRKDAMHPDLITWYGRYPESGIQRDLSLSGTIQNPQSYGQVDHPYANFVWFADQRRNLWNASNFVMTLNNNPVVKTVYDPCPAGYCMPPSAAFTGFSTTGDNCDISLSRVFDYNGDGQLSTADAVGKGYYFYTNADLNALIYFSCDGSIMLDGSRMFNWKSRGHYHTAGPYAYSSYLFFFSDYEVYIRVSGSGYNGTGNSVRPIAVKREVFGSNGDSGATTTGVQVDNYDMGGNMWE